jgi:glutamyl-Q tRNA(Asp) synthetase
MAEGPLYSGVCRHLNYALTQANSGVRLNVKDAKISFQDRIQDRIQGNLQASMSHALANTCGDFILKRKDGLFAYQLAVVVDDYLEGITHIVRGADLLDSTPRQIYLQRLLGYPTPIYAHLPVALTGAGEKLSKQTLALALPLHPSRSEVTATLTLCLRFLGQDVEGLAQDNIKALLSLAAKRWNLHAVPSVRGAIGDV